MKRIHDSKIKNRVFNVGDRVLLFNSRLKIFSGKLKSRWSGPFTIAKVFPYGTVELSQANGHNFKVNGNRVKHYFRGDVPQLVVQTSKLPLGPMNAGNLFKLSDLKQALRGRIAWIMKSFVLSVLSRASQPQLHFGNPRIHDSKIKNRVFNVGDRVLLFNSRLKIFSGKLKSRWSGPFTIAKVFPYGTVELSQANGHNFKVNGNRVKHYFGGDVPQLVVQTSKLPLGPMNAGNLFKLSDLKQALRGRYPMFIRSNSM
nr:reverse transcriptase domain-containing protein [Tanacetum cinerariifolium]